MPSTNVPLCSNIPVLLISEHCLTNHNFVVLHPILHCRHKRTCTRQSLPLLFVNRKVKKTLYVYGDPWFPLLHLSQRIFLRLRLSKNWSYLASGRTKVACLCSSRGPPSSALVRGGLIRVSLIDFAISIILQEDRHTCKWVTITHLTNTTFYEM